ncbi:MAG TPA: adenosylcobinamide-GDP ribazoletransferase [Natronosporangium sp.]
MGVVSDFRTAVGFLTRLPAGVPTPRWPAGAPADRGAGSAGPGGGDLTAAGGYFPLVGAIVAAIGIGVWAAVDALVGPVAAAVASVLATAAVTGAFHEDGLADTVDGFWGGATPQQRLEVMRDSRLGTYGAVALTGDLLLRIGLLVPLDLLDVARVLVAGHVIGRAAPLVLAAWLPPARSEGQGVRMSVVNRGGAVLAAATVTVAAVAAAGWWAPAVVGAAALAVAAVRRAARRRIGGVTGDVLGAGVQVANLAAAATVAALANGGLLWDG